MQIHQISKSKKRNSVKRVGRGGKRGTYSGRGMKGQKSRSGARIRPAIRDFIQQVPKLRGGSSNTGAPASSYNKVIIATVSLDRIIKVFPDGGTVSPVVLYEKRLIKRIRGRIPRVKILGGGTIPKNIIIKDCLLSKNIKKEGK